MIKLFISFLNSVNFIVIYFGALYSFLKRFYLFIFRERGREGDREGEKHQCVVASPVVPTGDLACNPGMFPDWESDQQPFDSFIGRHSIH